MKPSTFNARSFLKMLISTQLFLLMTFGLLAQTISGTVYDACIGTPLAGATISIQFDPPNGPPMSYTFKTKPDGTWDFSFFASDPDVPYHIYVLGGASSPTSYVYYRKNGNQSGFDFSLLQKQWDITINGEEISWQNNPQSPLTLCRNMDNCLKLTGLEGDPFVPRTDHCFQVRLYDVPDAGSGNPGVLLASSFCDDFVDRRPDIPCGDEAFDLNELFAGLTTIPPLMRLEVWHFCCNRECNPGETDLLNKEVVFIEVSEIGPAQACFMLEDPDGVNLIAPGTDCENAVAYCQVDVEIDGTCSSGAIDRYWMEVSEYDISTCQFIRVLADGSSHPTSISSLNDLDGINLNNYVRDHWVVDPNPQWPYFYLANPPKKFKVTLYVENACGVYSQTGWFDNSIQCLTGDGNGENSLMPPPVSNNELAQTGGGLNISIFPNPITDFSKLQFQLSNEVEVLIEVINISGEVLKRIEAGMLPKGINNFSLDLSGFPSGIYLLKIYAGDESVAVKVAKF